MANQAIHEVLGAGEICEQTQVARSDGLLMCGVAPKQAKIDWRSSLMFLTGVDEDEMDGNGVAHAAG